MPLAAKLVLRALLTISEILDVEVLVIGAGVGDAPRDVLVVAEVRKARTSGKGQADYVEVGTGDMVLIVNVWRIEPPVRVSRHQRLAGRRPRAVHRPVVGAAIVVLEPFDCGETVLQMVDAVNDVGFGLRAWRDDNKLAGEAGCSLVAPNTLDPIAPLVAVTFQETGGALRAKGVD